MIYTTGYQVLKPPRLKAIAAHLDAIVVDCRCSTRSRIAGFGGRQLAELLGDDYTQQGDKLGGRGQTTATGIEWLRRYDSPEHSPRVADQPMNALLMCLEEEPWQCHRHTDIVKPHFPDALHIYAGLLYSPADIELAIETQQMPPSRGELFPSE